MMKRNQHGRYYVGGKATDKETRTSVINLYSQGHTFKEITEKKRFIKIHLLEYCQDVSRKRDIGAKGYFLPKLSMLENNRGRFTVC
jgi:hypothetical protein